MVDVRVREQPEVFSPVHHSVPAAANCRLQQCLACHAVSSVLSKKHFADLLSFCCQTQACLAACKVMVITLFPLITSLILHCFRGSLETSTYVHVCAQTTAVGHFQWNFVVLHSSKSANHNTGFSYFVLVKAKYVKNSSRNMALNRGNQKSLPNEDLYVTIFLDFKT